MNDRFTTGTLELRLRTNYRTGRKVPIGTIRFELDGRQVELEVELEQRVVDDLFWETRKLDEQGVPLGFERYAARLTSAARVAQSRLHDAYLRQKEEQKEEAR